MEIQSIQGTMVGWFEWLIGLANTLNYYWESTPYMGRARGNTAKFRS